MTTPCTIHTATTKDITFIYQGILEVCKIEHQRPEKKKILLQQIRKALKKHEVLVAKKQETTIGFIQFTFSNQCPYGLEYGTWDRRYCWIEWMFVHHHERNRNVGKKLFQAVREVCKKKKIKEILLDVFDVNKGAQKFYDKINFTTIIHIKKVSV